MAELSPLQTKDLPRIVVVSSLLCALTCLPTALAGQLGPRGKPVVLLADGTGGSPVTHAVHPAAVSARAASADPSYKIGPEDVLNVSVWKEPEISQTVPVRPDGRISLPLINDIQAAGLTPTQLATTVTARLRQYLSNPQVTVVVTQINSQRIYILGEVNRAGTYTLFPGMTLLQALSNAGGFTQFADLKKIYLLRMQGGRQIRFPMNYKDVVHGRAPQQNVVLVSGDTIIVP